MAANAPLGVAAHLLGEVDTWIARREHGCHADVEPGETVNLERESHNARDPGAIRVENGRFRPVGYLPRKVSRWLAPLIDAEKLRVESYVPLIPGNVSGRGGKRTPLKLSLFVTEKGRDLLQQRLPRNSGDALHEVVRQAYLLARDCQSAELLQELAIGLRTLNRRNLLPETHLLLALLPTMGQELRAAECFGVLAEFRRLLGTLVIGEPMASRSLWIFPLFWPEAHVADYCLLDQATADGVATVEEVNESGQVSLLRLINRCDRPILIPEGEILLGAKQNRVVNLTVLVAPHAQVTLPVSCVEQGRRRYRSRTFQTAACFASLSLRSKTPGSVQRGRELRGTAQSDQLEMWDEVAAGLRDLGVASGTHSLADGFTAVEDELQVYREQFSLPEGAAGVAIAHGRQLVGLDLFDSHETLAARWERLRRACFFDVLRGRRSERKPDARIVRGFLHRIADCAKQRVPVAGMGEELEICGETVVGAALLHSGRIWHLAAFSERR